MHIHHVVISEVVGPPDLLKELGTGKGAAGVPGQRDEQIILGGREGERHAVEGGLVAGLVNLERAEHERLGLPECRGRFAPLSATARAAQHGAHTGDQFARRERLGQVVVGAHLQPDHAVDLLSAGGEHEHVGVGKGAQLATDLQPIESGKHQIEHQQVRVVGPDQLKRLRPIGGLQHSEACLREIALQQLAQSLLVIDYQNRCRRCHLCPVPSVAGTMLTEALA
jgi:hypothetical protein